MENTNNKKIYGYGFTAGLFAFIATLSYVIVQVLQIKGLLAFPLDEMAIYGTSLCIVVPFLLQMLALHHVAPPEKKYWSHAALLCTTIYAVFVTTNYVVQLATVIPAKLDGNYEQIRMLDQTPHSLFWDFDAMGYIFMGLATVFAIPVFSKTGFHKWVRISLIANGLVTPLITFVYFYPAFSASILLLGLPWAVTAPLAMMMMTIAFKRGLQPYGQPSTSLG